jgi:hypothetical protein
MNFSDPEWIDFMGQLDQFEADVASWQNRRTLGLPVDSGANLVHRLIDLQEACVRMTMKPGVSDEAARQGRRLIQFRKDILS